jgi:hypothetical protein
VKAAHIDEEFLNAEVQEIVTIGNGTDIDSRVQGVWDV